MLNRGGLGFSLETYQAMTDADLDAWEAAASTVSDMVNEQIEELLRSGRK